MMELMPVGKAGYKNKLSELKQKLESMGYDKDDEYFDEELGTGYLDEAGIFHPYGFTKGDY